MKSWIYMWTYLGSSISAVANVDEVTKLWWINFLILGCNQERRYSNELKLWPSDFVTLKVSIDQVDGQVQGFGDELEFQVNLHEPIHKNRSHAFVDVRLVLHVKRSDGCQGFFSTEVLIHVLNVSGGAQRIFCVAFIDVVGRSKLIRIGHRNRCRSGASDGTCNAVVSTDVLARIDNLYGSGVDRISLLHDVVPRLRLKAVLTIRDVAISCTSPTFLRKNVHGPRFVAAVVHMVVGISQILMEEKNQNR